ncbi:hypothetical protein [Streptomyces sp. NBC_01217]|uniref:hypothetical protein n=1 Tax=Streptomyces sp. NBC_01217 TaxID=2903779 RepID=UPI002E112339|nr:hypothetical protein OG507_39635 [Streptomyces sp. NBC_01217]
MTTPKESFTRSKSVFASSFAVLLGGWAWRAHHHALRGSSCRTRFVRTVVRGPLLCRPPPHRHRTPLRGLCYGFGTGAGGLTVVWIQQHL